MATLLFVHGTGVRRDAYARSISLVETHAAVALPGVRVVPCLWGEACGVTLRSGGLSVPNYRRTLAVDAASDGDRKLALWAVLYEDPLFELRAVAAEAGPVTGFAPGRRPPGDALAEACRKVTPAEHADLAAALSVLGIADAEFTHARDAVLDAAACRESLAKTPAGLEPQRTALARAVVSRAVADQFGRDDAGPCLDAGARDRAVAALAGLLAPAHLGLGAWAGKQLFGLAARIASYPVQRTRGALTNAAFPFAGDVLRYQSRGAEVRAFVRERLEEIRDDVILLAHSLGGIASFELLATTPAPNVKLFVTAGSQAPFLYEIDALATLRHGEALPGNFPRWVNIYDPKDLLGYAGAGVFPGRVTDEEVHNRQPFPAAHSAYWANPRTWQVVAQHWQNARGNS